MLLHMPKTRPADTAAAPSAPPVPPLIRETARELVRLAASGDPRAIDTVCRLLMLRDDSK